MDTQAYMNNLIKYATKFEKWWCKPCSEFQENYIKQNLKYNLFQTKANEHKLFVAVKQFEETIRKQYDLIEEIYDFLDLNYESYRRATPEERTEIRSIIKNNQYPVPKKGISYYMDYYLASLLLKYVKQRAIANLRSSGENIWVDRGLVGISIENFTVDYLDTLSLLADLYVTSMEKKVYPEFRFKEISSISDGEMSELMTNIGSTKIVYERKHDGYLAYKEFYDNP